MPAFFELSILIYCFFSKTVLVDRDSLSILSILIYCFVASRRRIVFHCNCIAFNSYLLLHEDSKYPHCFYIRMAFNSYLLLHNISLTASAYLCGILSILIYCFRDIHLQGRPPHFNFQFLSIASNNSFILRRRMRSCFQFLSIASTVFHFHRAEARPRRTFQFLSIASFVTAIVALCVIVISYLSILIYCFRVHLLRRSQP